ncbi:MULTISPECIES: LysR family transcriptional regulator [Thalassospira]|uniref:LysR family transcriptional regulator n=2 Tax=Thalassospiraceae TaxID=2844866 RepID=UPI0008DE4CC0|nr:MULTISPECIES: LysR family transcriptional regulator [Thalassospira]MAB35080.1 LysR family transcriptional regulator [Thalassospira sp.]MDM7976393.1 LysR family transcriptional regulator [Thalassospira xiamenensis]OHY97629.1 LysR family transcriptional regulator [Thalassospira sp. MIT1004]HBS25364.1 LysR family transcriptional regulator [Thalassospira sp.]
MARLETNRSGEMEVLVRVVERGGFSSASRDFNMTPSAVSKLVGRLEDRLGTRLFNRSTRKLHLTSEGQRFYERALDIIADINEAEQEVATAMAPRGRLRVTANVPVGLHRLLPLVPLFRERYPDITLDVTVSDKVMDLYEERADVAIRSGPLQSSGLIARKLGQCRMAIAASPSYLEKHGRPTTVDALQSHTLIGYNFQRVLPDWPFRVNGQDVSVTPGGVFDVADAESARQLALAGGGIVRLARFHIDAEVADGRLEVLLDEFYPGGGVDINAVYIGGRGHLPARVRAFLDFCAENIRLN